MAKKTAARKAPQKGAEPIKDIQPQEQETKPATGQQERPRRPQEAPIVEGKPGSGKRKAAGSASRAGAGKKGAKSGESAGARERGGPQGSEAGGTSGGAKILQGAETAREQA